MITTIIYRYLKQYKAYKPITARHETGRFYRIVEWHDFDPEKESFRLLEGTVVYCKPRWWDFSGRVVWSHVIEIPQSGEDPFPLLS